MFYFTKINNISTRYAVLGKGKNLILLPGWRTDLERIYPFLEFLSDYFKVYCLDLPGIGKTQKLEKNTILTYSSFVNNWIKYLKINNFILSGVSMGTQIISYSLTDDKIYNKTKSVILWLPVYNLECFKFKKLTKLSIKTLSLLLSKYPFSIIGDKIYKSDKIMKLIVKIFEHGKEAHKLKDPKNLEYHLQSFKRSSFDVTMETLHSLLKTNLDDLNEKFSIPTTIIISKKDPLIDYAKTINSYKKIFTNLNVESINREFHAPRTKLTKKFIKNNFKEPFEITIKKLGY